MILVKRDWIIYRSIDLKKQLIFPIAFFCKYLYGCSAMLFANPFNGLVEFIVIKSSEFSGDNLTKKSGEGVDAIRVSHDCSAVPFSKVIQAK